jgi:hypothetical protein
MSHYKKKKNSEWKEIFPSSFSSSFFFKGTSHWLASYFKEICPPI